MKTMEFPPMVKEIIELIKSHHKFILASHISPDGDCLSSMIGLGLLLRELGKEVEMINVDGIPDRYHSLPKKNLINTSFSNTFTPEIAIVLDSGALDRVGSVKEVISNCPILINIDHHLNSAFGTHNWVDLEASSVAEMICDLHHFLEYPINKERAHILYSGILTDTGGFKFSNVTPHTYEVCAHLLQQGIESHIIYEDLFLKHSLASMELLALVLETLELRHNEKIASMYLIRDMYVRTNTTILDTEGFINYATSIKGVEIALFFIEDHNIENDFVKVSLRAKGLINVNEVASLYGGGGHPNASGCTIKDDIFTIKHKIIEECRHRLDEIEEKSQ